MDSIIYKAHGDVEYSLAINAKAEKAIATLAAETGFAIGGITYLLGMGLKQSIADSIAGKAKALRDEGKSEAEIDKELMDIQAAKFEAIKAGTISTRASGPRLKPLERIVFEIGQEALRRAYAKAQRKWPTGEGAAEEIAKGVAQIWERRSDLYEAAKIEAERRMKALDFDLAL